jgi:demethylmenaquinone methyltransferase/2-methoxy-6-polyprenyl-1,4-benzoquinol methylase
VTEPSERIFARIAKRYDRFNRVLSLGKEQQWRARAAAFLPEGVILDLGSGTGAAAPVLPSRTVVALDPEPEMLALSELPLRVVGVGEDLPFRDETFDGVFSAYVFRNLTSVEATLKEIARVLRPGGLAAIVDLARPPTSVKAAVHRSGTTVVLPAAGTLAGAPKEYWYLHRSLDKLPPPEELLAHSPLRVEAIWRMGPLDFVYGAALRKRGTERR